MLHPHEREQQDRREHHRTRRHLRERHVRGVKDRPSRRVQQGYRQNATPAVSVDASCSFYSQDTRPCISRKVNDPG